jgi:hypothetical protein
MTVDLSGEKSRVLADAIRYRIEWCDAELAREPALEEDVRLTISGDKEVLVAMLATLKPARRATEPGHG